MNEYQKYVLPHRKLILDAMDYFWKNPETGYKEWKTHAYLVKAFEKLGYKLTPAGNIPGFITEIDTGLAGPVIAVFGEMDALVVPSHPDADPETGAVHACGHCTQIAALLGLAAALKEEGALSGLCGKIRLVAVPAEELIEVEYREELRSQGVIRYFGGKPEFMYRGLLDGVDMAFMVHAGSKKNAPFYMNGGSNGCITKSITFEGVSAHAGGSPHLGVNALYAANLAMNAVNALRETFRDNDHIRFHPIITHGGDAVNAIPETVKMESYVRGATMNEIVDINRKINRAIAASAAAIGAKVHLKDFPGYWPRRHTPLCCRITKEAMDKVCDVSDVNPSVWGTGCSDMGDVGAVMPALHPYVCCSEGTGHGNDYRIKDPELAGVGSAEFQLTLLAHLLKNGGVKAKEIIENYEPDFSSIQEYLNFSDALNLDQEAVIYEEKGRVILQYEKE